MLHFASHFLAQQLICCVHVFGCKNAPFVPGDHPTALRWDHDVVAIAYISLLPAESW